MIKTQNKIHMQSAISRAMGLMEGLKQRTRLSWGTGAGGLGKHVAPDLALELQVGTQTDRADRGAQGGDNTKSPGPQCDSQT